MKVPIFRHPLNQGDLKNVQEVIESLFIGTGTVAQSVEKQISEYFDGAYALLTNSWTNGALISLLSMDLTEEDEVIIPAMTFIASANVVELVGAKPVFVDVRPDTLLLDLEQTLAAVTPQTKVIMPVNLYGQLFDCKRLKAELMKMGRDDILIFEDSAHSFEARLNGDKTGAYSDLTAFSFYATKNITCGEGGAIITRNEKLYKRMLKARTHGMSASALNRYTNGGYNHWDMDCLGGKANMPDLLAVYLPRQIDAIDETVKQRIDVANCYRQAFENTNLRMQNQQEGSVSAEHLFVIHVPPAIRDEAIRLLNEAGIAITVNYRSVPRMIYYKEKYNFDPQAWPVAYEWGEGCISLPIYPSFPREEQDYVIQCVLDKVVPLIK